MDFISQKPELQCNGYTGKALTSINVGPEKGGTLGIAITITSGIWTRNKNPLLRSSTTSQTQFKIFSYPSATQQLLCDKGETQAMHRKSKQTRNKTKRVNPEMDNRIDKRMKNGMKMRLGLLLSGLTVFWFLEIFVAFTASWNTTTMEGSSNNQIPPHGKGYYEVKLEQQQQQPPDSNTTRTSSPPLDYVKIDLQKSKSAVSAIRNFLQQCPIIPSFQNATRLSKISHKSSFLTSPPACQELIYHPLILKAVRAVLGHADDDDRPIWVFAVTRIQRRLSRGQQTMCHRLHSDMEFSHPSCRPLGGATVWLYLDKDTNQCPGEQLQESPLTFFAGSHRLPQTAQQALSEHGCQSPDSRTPFNCSTADLMRKYSQSYPQYNLHRTMGPKELYRGIAWPSSTWHETRDICGRTSMTLEYVSSVECARHLTYIFPGPTAGTLAPMVDLPPLVPVNRAARYAEIDSFMALLSTGDSNSMDNRTTGALLNRTCLVKPHVGQTSAASSPAKRAPVVAIDSWHFSGKFKNSTRNFMERIGFSLKPTNEQTIRTAFFEYWLGRTRYICSKRGTLAHPPHSEPSIEVCAVIEGRINYAWAFGETGCSSGFLRAPI
ncbi:hypothetical protein IV203_027538 [Nitzschia inconspicua]|uniref:Uncharacterized protein n=1 Tax=Nitzschia inconspicua TaxID=303405 RepID=A0A9K3Q3F7_9STRA|nr:hypothetical protein IV203_027538 [Nitzschia inconspicua]